jgi:uncharacterized protein YggU (UPF0235/DUF167 family)
MKLHFTQEDPMQDGTWVSVKVHPGAGKDVLVQIGPGRFEAWVRAKPIEGRANEAVVRLLARGLQVQPDRVRLVKGHQARLKVFRLIG